jgi:hypothetical protein
MGSIHEAIIQVSNDLGTMERDQSVITDSGRIYRTVGIESIEAALQPLLVKHGITVIPSIIDVQSWDTKDPRGEIHWARAIVSFTLTGPDGSSVTGSSAGEGSGDTDKALPAAISLASKSWWKTVLHIKANDPDPDISGHGLSTAPAAPSASGPTIVTVSPAPAPVPAPAAVSRADALMASELGATVETAPAPPAQTPQSQPVLERAVQGNQQAGTVEMVSESQLKLISVILTGKKNDQYPNNQGMTQGQAYDFVEGVVGHALDRNVHYTKKFQELTKAEAKRVMDAIKQIPGVNLPDRPRQ